jgi:exoribonuclease R
VAERDQTEEVRVALRVLSARDPDADELRQGIAAIQQEQHLTPDFPPDVLHAAEEAAPHPRLPDLDRTDLELVTIDPPGSMDLDQAMHLTTDGDGYVVHYAIADLMAFIEPGDAVDTEAHRRGESLYGGSTRIPLHPPVLSEGAASLLPDQVRPAFLWTVRLDSRGEIVDARVERAKVRSRRRLHYDGVQHGTPPSAGSTLALLQTIGELRLAREAERGGVSLPMPEQQVDVIDGRWHLEFRSMLPVESWNAQISLLTGFAAASIMLRGQVGVLRTLPPPPDHVVSRLRRTAKALGIDWPPGAGHAEFIRSLDPTRPADAAMVVACTALLRGAGYSAFDGQPPDQPQHAALASTYAHVTAPLRRLVDRYGLEVCAALCAGAPVPAWARDGLAAVPAVMQQSGQRAHAYEHAVLDLVEALTLRPRVGEHFDGVVLEAEHEDERHGTVMVHDPAVEARISAQAPLPVGTDVSATLVQADPATRKVQFRL